MLLGPFRIYSTRLASTGIGSGAFVIQQFFAGSNPPGAARPKVVDTLDRADLPGQPSQVLDLLPVAHVGLPTIVYPTIDVSESLR